MSEKTLNRRFLLLQSLLTLIECVSTSYISPILVDLGYSTRWIGRIVALAALAAVIWRPLLGFINDRYSCAKQVLLGGTAVGVGCYFLLTHSNRLLWSILAVMGLHITILCLMNFVDSWALRLISSGYQLNYGGTRAGGSFSYAVGAVLLGMLIARYGYRPSNYVLWALFFLLVWVVCSIPSPPHEAEKVATLNLSKGISALITNRTYCLMLFAFFLCTLTSSAVESFYPVLLLESGGTEKTIGFALFLQAISEIPMMIGYAKLRKRTGFTPAALMGISMLFYGIKSLLMGIASSLPLMVAATVLQIFTFALFTPACIDFMLCTVTQEYLATAHLIFVAIGQAISSVFGGLLSGALADVTSVSFMLRVASIPAFAAGLLAFAIVGKQRKENSHDISGL